MRRGGSGESIYRGAQQSRVGGEILQQREVSSQGKDGDRPVGGDLVQKLDHLIAGVFLVLGLRIHGVQQQHIQGAIGLVTEVIVDQARNFAFRRGDRYDP